MAIPRPLYDLSDDRYVYRDDPYGYQRREEEYRRQKLAYELAKQQDKHQAMTSPYMNGAIQEYNPKDSTPEIRNASISTKLLLCEE